MSETTKFLEKLELNFPHSPTKEQENFLLKLMSLFQQLETEASMF